MPKPRSALRTCAALAALGTLAPPGHGQRPLDDALGETLWLCWYNHDSTFRCRLARAPETPPEVRAQYARRADRTSSRRSLYPKRGPLPPIVKTIQEQPDLLRSRTITIPLFTPPRDLAFAATLVQAVMCDIRPACRAQIMRSSTAVIDAFEEDPARD
ncbi:hypothetical protein [Azoarcus sp. KH32C]|uniref:hypothetical protein n=1 Tax=Azoarcus sp. KH32C TaxID=748247 RepID=UPI0002386366|nr:hypothetical protein [Azoarcus sp. KH32C]BAL22517.1 hypothetical protein AZKH_0171 [Azoarcus sp. KH32C]